MLSKRTKLIINIITFAALAVLIYFSWPQIKQGITEISGANIAAILLMLPMQIINFYAVAMLYKSYFKSVGEKLPSSVLFKVALELNFINNIFPSGGIAGFSYLSYRLRRVGIPVAKTTLAQLMRFGLTFLSFLVILFFGMFLLAFGSGTSGKSFALFVGLSIAFLTLFGTVVGIFIISNEKRIKSFTAFLPKLVNIVIKPFTHKTDSINIARVEKLFGDLHNDYIKFSKNWRNLKTPIFWAFIINITEIATIYFAYIALNNLVNPGAVILAYSVASFAGLISILPGGIGVYEALMTGVLATAGVPKALALSATLIYRIFTMIVFLPVGFILYQIALKHGEAEVPPREPANTFKPF